MKRVLSLCLVLCCLLCLSACSAASVMKDKIFETGQNSGKENPSSVELTNEQDTTGTEEKSHVIVHVDPVRYEAYDPNTAETLILTFAYDSARVLMEDKPASAARINEMLGKMDDDFYSGSADESSGTYGYQDMLSEAEDLYAIFHDSERDGSELVLASERTIRSIRATDSYLEIDWMYYDYLGGAHGGYAFRTTVFDTETGEELHLSDLFTEGYDYRSAILAEMIRLTQEDKDNYYSDHTEFVDPESREEVYAALLRDGSWCFTDSGLVFTSDLYELGSYAVGLCEFEITYETFGDSFLTKYLPKQLPSQPAVMGLVPAEDGRESGYEIIDRAVIHPDGEDLLLTVENCACDIRICSVSYLDSFYDQTLLWYADSVHNAAIQLKLRVPQGMPDTMISYSDSEGEHSLLVQYEKDNGFSLKNEEEIVAVG